MDAIRQDDIQDIVSEVRAMLELRNDPTEAELQRLSQKYVSVIQQINSMLKTCLELVEKGLKSEAIMRADEHSLLEIVSILDFPEQQVWVDYLHQFGFPTPPAIDHFASRQINACYAPARRLEPLYRLNRRHALANSPLRVRLAVMRRIHKTEVATAKEVAGRQVELFETERLKGVRKELADAQQAQDHKRLHLLCAELSSKDWLKAPDPGLVRSAVRALKQEEARRARLQMKGLVLNLQDKWSAHDVAGGRRIRETWNNCQAKAQLPEDDPMLQQTRAAFAWLQEIDEEESRKQKYDELVAQLRDGLDQRHRRESLELLEHALEGYDDGVPVSLRSRLQTRYDELETESRRKNVRRLVVVSLSVISIAGLAVFVLHHRNVNNRIDAHVAAMTTLLERDDVEYAKSYADTLQKEHTDMLVVPQIKVLLLDIEQAGRDEEDRREAFETGIATITERLNSVITLADAKSLQLQLDALNSRREEEIENVQQLSEGVANKQNEIQEQIDGAFTLSLQKVAAELKDYEQSGERDVKRFKEFRTTLLELEKIPDVSAELISVANGPKALVARCETSIFEMNVQIRRDQMLRQITASVGSVPQYRAAIDAYVKEFPKEDRLAIRFENLLRTEADFWPQVDVQNEFVRQHAVDCTRLKPLEARKYLAESEAFLITHPQFPRRTELTKICEFLRFVSQRLDETGEPIHAGIMDQLNKANLQDLYTVQLLTGERHYTDKEPEFRKEVGRIQFARLPDWLAAQRQRETVTRNLAPGTVDIHTRDGQPDWEAPESVLIREIERALNDIDEHDWERVMIEMLERVYGETRQDPIFRLFMLRTILETAMSGSPVVSTHYARVLEQLKNEPLNNINPFDPDDEATNLKRKHAAELLKPIRNPATLLPELVPLRESMSKLSIGGQYRWCGWLNRDPSGWVCLCDKPFAPDFKGSLFIYAKGAADAPRLFQIGTISHGTPTVSDTSAILVEGQPVYVYQE